MQAIKQEIKIFFICKYFMNFFIFQEYLILIKRIVIEKKRKCSTIRNKVTLKGIVPNKILQVENYKKKLYKISSRKII